MSEPRLVVLQAAFDDILEQAIYFENKSGVPLARQWGSAVQTSVQSLKTMPLRGSTVDLISSKLQRVRRVPVQGFERYAIVYTIDSDQAVLTVIAVLHTSRDIAALLATPRT